MKLYATTTALKGQNGSLFEVKKGQGSNYRLSILINGETENLFRIDVEYLNGWAYTTLLDYSDGEITKLLPKELREKGKSQKGEKCYHCSATTKTSQLNWHCSNCGHDN
jgi:hypothetical protein